MEGCPWRMNPEFIWVRAGPWLLLSACMPRITQSLSACLERCGYFSEIHIPDWPYCWKEYGEGKAVGLVSLVKKLSSLRYAGIVLPAHSLSAGFGSKVSTWLGPPYMKRKMTESTLAGW